MQIFFFQKFLGAFEDYLGGGEEVPKDLLQKHLEIVLSFIFLLECFYNQFLLMGGGNSLKPWWCPNYAVKSDRHSGGGWSACSMETNEKYLKGQKPLFSSAKLSKSTKNKMIIFGVCQTSGVGQNRSNVIILITSWLGTIKKYLLLVLIFFSLPNIFNQIIFRICI